MIDLAGKRITLELQSQTRDGRPFVSLTLGDAAILLDPTEARSLGTLLFEFAAGAEHEAALLAVLERHRDDHTLDGLALIHEIGRERTEQRKRPKVN